MNSGQLRYVLGYEDLKRLAYSDRKLAAQSLVRP